MLIDVCVQPCLGTGNSQSMSASALTHVRPR